MDSLATIADCEDRLGSRIDDDDQRVRLNALLADASSAIRAYTGRQWATGHVTLKTRPRGPYVKLSVTAPATVANITVIDPVTTIDVPFQFDGIDRLYLWPLFMRDGFERDFCGIPSTVVVGYDTTCDVPAAIVAVCCQTALRAYGLAPTDSGHQQEAIAGYSYSVGIAAAAGGVGFLPDERRILDAFRNVGQSMWVGSVL